MRHRISVCLSLALVFIVGLTSVFGQEKLSTDVAQTLKQLRQVKVEDEIGYDVPAADIRLIPRLKHQLLHLFEQVLQSGGPELTAADARQRVLAKLRNAGIQVGDGTLNASGYGYLYELEVTQPPEHQDLLVFRHSVGIACGDDGSLYVFQKEKSRWRLVIAVESNGYKQVKGGLGSLTWGLSPPGAQGGWFLAYAHDLPWCTSMWNELEYSAVRPGRLAYRPRVLVAGSEGLYLGDDYVKLAITGDGFQMDFEAGQSLDVDLLTRLHVVRYRIAGDHAIRIPPLAHSPEGFLDEWSQLPWAVARRWSKPASKLARQGHDLLHDQKLLRELDFVQPCEGGNKWQIGVSLNTEQENQNRGQETGHRQQATGHSKQQKPKKQGTANNEDGTGDGEQQKEEGQMLFATVTRTGETYWLTQIGNRRPPGCPGNAQPSREITRLVIE